MVENYGAVYCTEAGVAKFDRSLIFGRTIHGPEASKRVQRLSNSAASANMHNRQARPPALIAPGFQPGIFAFTQ